MSEISRREQANSLVPLRTKNRDPSSQLRYTETMTELGHYTCLEYSE